VLTNEGLRKGAWGVGLIILSPRTRQSLWLGWKTGDGNPKLQGLGPLGKSTAGINSTHLKVRVSPR